MTYKEFLKEKVADMTSDELVELYNEVQENIDGDYIYDNDENFMDEMFTSANDAVRAVCYGKYEYLDSYVKFENDGNLKSGKYFSDLIDEDDFINTLADNEYFMDEFNKRIKVMKREYKDYVRDELSKWDMDELVFLYNDINMGSDGECIIHNNDEKFFYKHVKDLSMFKKIIFNKNYNGNDKYIRLKGGIKSGNKLEDFINYEEFLDLLVCINFMVDDFKRHQHIKSLI